MKFSATWGWLLVIAIFITSPLWAPTDNSDRSRFKRSGLQVHVDALTGVNYFTTPGFCGIGKSICVRVDTNGYPVVSER